MLFNNAVLTVLSMKKIYLEIQIPHYRSTVSYF